MQALRLSEEIIHRRFDQSSFWAYKFRTGGTRVFTACYTCWEEHCVLTPRTPCPLVTTWSTLESARCLGGLVFGQTYPKIDPMLLPQALCLLAGWYGGGVCVCGGGGGGGGGGGAG